MCVRTKQFHYYYQLLFNHNNGNKMKLGNFYCFTVGCRLSLLFNARFFGILYISFQFDRISHIHTLLIYQQTQTHTHTREGPHNPKMLCNTTTKMLAQVIFHQFCIFFIIIIIYDCKTFVSLACPLALLPFYRKHMDFNNLTVAHSPFISLQTISRTYQIK